MVTLPLVALLNFVLPRGEPSVSITVESISNRLGVEDYFMNKKVMLTDLALNIDAGNIYHIL